MTATDTAVRLALIAGHAAAEKLATDIVLIDVSERLAITDVFVIATGSSERQVEAVVDEIEEKLRHAGCKPLRREGKRDGRWVLLDYAEIVVHVQHAEERVFYALERLWRDCPLIEFDPLGQPPAPLPTDAVDTADHADDDADHADADEADDAAAEVELDEPADGLDTAEQDGPADRDRPAADEA